MGELLMTNVINMNGELLGIQELNERLCEGYSEEKGVVGLKEGAYLYYNSNEMETKEDNEINGEVMEYIKLDGIKTLYDEFLENFDEMYMEVSKYNINKEDTVLEAVVRNRSNNTIYFYNIFRDYETREIITNIVSMNKSMLNNLFVA